MEINFPFTSQRLVEPIKGKFREVIFDFKKVKALGQDFLDELSKIGELF